MSFYRFVYYSAVVAGWMALAAWLGAELLIFNNRSLGGMFKTAAAGTLLGAMIGVGLSLVAGMTNAQWRQQVRRTLPGLLAGGLGGLLGGMLGEFLYAGLGQPRFLGWMIMGLGIGSADGLYDRSGRKIRNGLIGGALGGLIGGLLFDRIASTAADMASRATGFVILGLAVGALVGLAQVVLKEAWLTVLDGYRPGRQLILSQTVTVLGRGDHLPLPFLSYAGRDLENEHLRIVRQPDGQFVIEDIGSRLGTMLNGKPLTQPTTITDGDLVKLGGNIVRFNHRQRTSAAGVSAAAQSQGFTGTIPRPPAPATALAVDQPPSVTPPVPGPVSAPIQSAAAATTTSDATLPSAATSDVPGGGIRPPTQPGRLDRQPPTKAQQPPDPTPRIPPPPPPPGKSG